MDDLFHQNEISEVANFIYLDFSVFCQLKKIDTFLF